MILEHWLSCCRIYMRKRELYKLVFIGRTGDNFRTVTDAELRNLPDVYCSIEPLYRLKGIVRFIYRVHNSTKINSFVRLPFRKIWASFFLDKSIKRKLDKDDKIIFYFSGTDYYFDANGLFQYIRLNYPNSFLIFALEDRVELYCKTYRGFSIQKITTMFDSVVTYNVADSKEYNIRLAPPRLINFSFVEENSNLPDTDVFFIGQEKGRLEQIFSVFDRCKVLGLKCDFYIIGVPREKQRYVKEIKYNQRLSYQEVIQHAKKTKAIINIIQSGGDGITLRDYEAIGLNKILITNGKYIDTTAFYSEKNIVHLDEIESKLPELLSQSNIVWNGKDDYSIEKWREWIENIVK